MLSVRKSAGLILVVLPLVAFWTSMAECSLRHANTEENVRKLKSQCYYH